MADANVVHLTEENFESEVIKSDKPVLVDFWAPWCGPCKMIAPTIDELAAESTGKYVVAKLNTDEASSVAAKYGISGIPSLLVFKSGNVVQRFVGLTAKNLLKSALEAAV